MLTVSATCCQTRSPSGASELGRGSEACRAWQDAICDYTSDRCGTLPREDCDAQYQSVTCKSDAKAAACASELGAASCRQPPDNCTIDSIADPSPATEACSEMLDRICTRATDCGVTTSKEACLALPEVRSVDCNAAIAFSLDFEMCLEQIDQIQCETIVLPKVCKSVIIQRAPVSRVP